MQSAGVPWLSSLIVLPLAGALALVVVEDSLVRWVARGITPPNLMVALPLGWFFDPASSQMKSVEHVSWIPSPPIHYSLGLDGISLPLVLMTAGLLPLCVLASWQAVTARIRGF